MTVDDILYLYLYSGGAYAVWTAIENGGQPRKWWDWLVIVAWPLFIPFAWALELWALVKDKRKQLW